MRLIAPDYYQDFICIADKCRHSCCVSWEIDIDEDTAEYYQDVGGDIGKKLKENILQNEDGFSFRLDRNDRCPFLTGNGLCELILELGEDSLCEICREHPRFRNYYSDRTEIGLGLCCESAAKMILTKSESVSIVCLRDDGETEACESSEQDTLSFRDMLVSIAQDRSYNILERISIIESMAEPHGQLSPSELAEFMLGLERLDESWTGELKSVSGVHSFDLPICFAATEWQAALEQLLVYLLYRHTQLENFELFAISMWRLIAAILSSHSLRGEQVEIDDLIELCRMWSCEIEYSDENIELINERLMN